jgi:sigma-E factor negative regulatory protein RseC
VEICGTARVVRASGARAIVVLDRHGACASCQTSDLCHSLAGRGTVQLEVENPLGAKEGQQVEISSTRSLGLQAAFMAYLLPAVLFVAGVVVGAEVLEWPPWGSGLLGLGGLVVAWLIAWAYDRHASRRPEFRLAISSILTPAHLGGQDEIS